MPGSTIAELIKWSYADYLVEVMPPDETNTEIALRLNRAESPAMQAWLVEAAE
ncbi:hypothetical protein [Paenibacillus polymyxa]|nr:hypothetical protein [Paenibacillus polymyxa]URJ49564.3 hypothetical protein MF626_003956 [Paenibacillus polymyxa]